MEQLIAVIGGNLSRIRKERGLSLDQVSALTGVSKGMLGQIEKGRKTPSVTVLWKIANGLKVSISALMKSSQTQVTLLSLTPEEMLTEDGGKYRTGALVPFDTETRFEALKMDLEPGGTHSSTPHAAGVTEYVFVATGSLEMEIEGACHQVGPGQAIVFQGDVGHIYRNRGQEPVNTFIVIHYAV